MTEHGACTYITYTIYYYGQRSMREGGGGEVSGLPWNSLFWLAQCCTIMPMVAGQALVNWKVGVIFKFRAPSCNWDHQILGGDIMLPNFCFSFGLVCVLVWYILV